MINRSESLIMRKLVVFAFLWLCPVRFGLAETSENPIFHSLSNYEPDIEPYDDRQRSIRPIFNYRNNGVKIDIKIVPAVNDSTGDTDERFPDFPTKDLSRCLFDLSISCARDRIARLIDTVGNLKEITLFGPGIKLVKTRALQRTNGERRMIDATDGGVGKIDRSIDDFFDSFALRISLPRMNAKKERNQIDVMFDDNGIVEGRGKKGGGGGKGGGKCKKMMMMMMMMGKMKLMAMAGMMSMKGMMMAGMSLMISKAMLIMKLMSLKMGGGGGGGSGGGGGGQLKEIVLLTKASGGGGGGGGGGPSDSYGAPPPSSYGAPSSGGGGYDHSGGGGGGGGGWGRSFNDRMSMTSSTYQPESTYPEDSDNLSETIDINSADQPSNDSEFQNSSNNWNGTTAWSPWKSWNITESVKNPNQNITDGSTHYDPKNDEFEAIGINKSTIDETINKIRSKAVRAIYAKKWKNYEAGDRIFNSTAPIVALRRTSRGRSPKSIPIAAA